LRRFVALQSGRASAGAIAIKLTHWGLFASFNLLVKTVLHAVTSNVTICLHNTRENGPVARHACCSFCTRLPSGRPTPR
jgi:hypothetical protein